MYLSQSWYLFIYYLKNSATTAFERPLLALLCGLKLVVEMRLILNLLATAVIRLDIRFCAQSLSNVSGHPNMQIKWLINAVAIVLVRVSFSGTAAKSLLSWHCIANTYLKPLDDTGPKISMLHKKKTVTGDYVIVVGLFVLSLQIFFQKLDVYTDNVVCVC